MSWVLAVVGEAAGNTVLSRLHPVPLFQVQRKNFYLAAGGIPQTCLHGTFDRRQDGDDGFLVVGCGIQRHEGYCTFPTASQWQQILSPETPSLSSLDGHFIAMRWRHSELECFTDQFGLRTLFVSRVETGVAVSTRVDWIARLKGGADIAFEQFGAHWMSFNQFSHESMVQGISRVGPGGELLCNHESFTARSSLWTPGPDETSDEELVSILHSLINPKTPEPFTLSLGLSGGLDSRLLLALLMAKQNPFVLHLFGSAHEPDVVVAQRMATDEHLDQTRYCDPIPPVEKCVSQLKDYVCKTSLAAPPSTMLKLRYYDRMHARGLIMIDGGMGEIARRQFMNRLLWKGKRFLHSGNPEFIARYVTSPRARIFNTETTQLMQRGIEEQLTQVWDSMPRIGEIGVENFLDLMIVRYRFPNYGGLDQSRMDEEIVGWMPFAQPAFVRAAFGVPVTKKTNGRLFRQLIRKHRPSLTKYPLVKGTMTYPYAFPTVPAWAYTTLKRRLTPRFVDPTSAEFLSLAADFVRDTAHSITVKSYPAYDYPLIVRMIDEFYSGRKDRAAFVEWWLAFEMWRSSLSAGKS